MDEGSIFLDSKERRIGKESIIEKTDWFILSLMEGSYVGGSIFGNIVNSKLLGDEVNEGGGVIVIVISRDRNFD